MTCRRRSGEGGGKYYGVAVVLELRSLLGYVTSQSVNVVFLNNIFVALCYNGCAS